jgi:hypothetical protein
MKVEIKYYWSPITRSPNEVTSVTMMSLHVPRLGDTVGIQVEVEPGEMVEKYGVVADVVWLVKATATTVSIQIR